MAATKASSSKRWIVIGLCVIVGIGAVAVIGMDVMRRAVSMSLADTNASAVLASPSGVRIKAVLRIGQPAGASAFMAEILENAQGADYRATGQDVRLALAPDTHFIMGASSDVKPGAIVQADGAMDGARSLRAAKIVVLNDYVHVTR